MPCYDKKLEASRDDFVFQLEPHAEGHEGEEDNLISEVDSVLTTGEILELIQVSKFYAYLHTIIFVCEFFSFTIDVYVNSCLRFNLSVKRS